MKLKLLLMLALLTPLMGAGNGPTTVEGAVDFMNLILRAPDPPPPRHWKIHLDVPEQSKKTKMPLAGKDLQLHEVLGKIADTIGAEVAANRYGYVLREPQTLPPDVDDGWTPPGQSKVESSEKDPAPSEENDP